MIHHPLVGILTSWSMLLLILACYYSCLPTSVQAFSSLHYSSPSTTTTTTHRRRTTTILDLRRPTTTTRLGATTDEIPSLYQEQEKLLVSRGEYEGELMKDTWVPLEPNQVKGAGAGGGFGGMGGNKGSKHKKKPLKQTSQTKSLWTAQAQAHAQTFRREGILRLDNVLSADTASALRDSLYQRRHESEALIQTGTLRPLDRFADVLLKTNRCDMPVPLLLLEEENDDSDDTDDTMQKKKKKNGKNIVAQALHEVLLSSPVGPLVDQVFATTTSSSTSTSSASPILYELSCLMSDPGSQRQVVHPDNPYLEGRDEPTLLTCFIALQDITLEMGPTTWLPQTHTAEMHQAFQNDAPPPQTDNDNDSPRRPLSEKDRLLATQPAVLGLLPRGSCGIYDSRLLHCGGANRHADRSRALFYVSFQNPRVGYPGNPPSILRELRDRRLTLRELQEDLQAYEKGQRTRYFG